MRNDRDLKRDPREDGLPKWAQQHLNVLRMRVREARDAADAQLGDGARSNVWLRAAHSNDLEYLPSRFDAVRFYVGPHEHDWIDLRVESIAGETTLHVQTHDELMIRPHVSNGVAVAPARTFLAAPPNHMAIQAGVKRRRP